MGGCLSFLFCPRYDDYCSSNCSTPTNIPTNIPYNTSYNTTLPCNTIFTQCCDETIIIPQCSILPPTLYIPPSTSYIPPPLYIPPPTSYIIPQNIQQYSTTSNDKCVMCGDACSYSNYCQNCLLNLQQDLNDQYIQEQHYVQEQEKYHQGNLQREEFLNPKPSAPPFQIL